MRNVGVPWTQFVQEVLDIYGLERRPKTVGKMRQVLNEFTGLVKTTSELKPATIARWRKTHPDRAPSTVHSLMRSLRSACEIGIASGYMVSSPLAVKQVWPELEDSDDEERHHAISEIRAVLLHLRTRAGFSWHDHRLYALAATVAYTGVRRNEALHLMISDVDFDRKCIRIVNRRTRPSVGRRAAKMPKLKTKASAAPVGMPDELVGILEPWTFKAGSAPKSAIRPTSLAAQLWLYPGATGTGPWTGGPPGYKPLDCLKAAGLAVGVRGFTFQSLRHSWATHGEFWGLGETMIQRQLRHTTRKTQKVYRHADLANLATSVRSISFRLEDAPAIARTV